MPLLAPYRSSADGRSELELLIREARRRQWRRRAAVLLWSLVLAGGGYLLTLSFGSFARPKPLLARPLHFPSLQPGARCPVSSGYMVSNPYFAGPAYGHGPVRLLLAQAGDFAHGSVDILPGMRSEGWYGLQTLWFAVPGYDGPFVVRAARLGARGPIEVQPGETSFVAGSGPLVVPGGPTLNSYPAPTAGTYRGYRTVPGSTWIKAPGCYAWQVDGRGFSEVLVVNAVAATG